MAVRGRKSSGFSRSGIPTVKTTDAVSHGATVYFTPREQQILHLSAFGRSDKQIAAALRISPSTLRTHMDRLFQREGFHSRAAAVAMWIVTSYGLDIPMLPTAWMRAATKN